MEKSANKQIRLDKSNTSKASNRGTWGRGNWRSDKTNPFLIDDISHKHRHKPKQPLAPQGSKVRVGLFLKVSSLISAGTGCETVSQKKKNGAETQQQQWGTTRRGTERRPLKAQSPRSLAFSIMLHWKTITFRVKEDYTGLNRSSAWTRVLHAGWYWETCCKTLHHKPWFKSLWNHTGNAALQGKLKCHHCSQHLAPF